MTDQPPAGTLIAGRYELIETVGAGAVGRVYAARDRRLGRRVAIKLIDASQARSADPATTERFVAEARSGATFTDPHAVTVFDAGTTDEHLYLVTELVEGTTLAAHLAAHGALAIDEAVSIVDQVLQALGAAHRAGIVHRDVKPSNVLLGDDGTVKLADFGIAKRLDQVQASLTSTGNFVGTAGYAAPEQAAGLAATPATDLYAAGVTLYEMLAGITPYTGDAPFAVALAHRDAPIPDVRAARPDVPLGVAQVVTRSLAKDPADRFGDAAEMRSALSGGRGPAATAVADTVPPATDATVPGEVTPLATGHRPESLRDRSRRWWGVAAALVIVGLGVLGVAALASDRGSSPPAADEPDGDDGDGAGAGAVTSSTSADHETTTSAARTTATTAAPSSTPPPSTTTSPPATTEPATTPTPMTAPAPTPVPPPLETPGDVPSLIEVVERDPDAAGRRGRDLQRELEKVDEREGERRYEAAEEAEDRIDDWVDDGELDSELGELAMDILDEVMDAVDDEDD